MQGTIRTKNTATGAISSDIRYRSTLDHDKLINRDEPDQHPIEAITGLAETIKDLADQIQLNSTKIDGVEGEVTALELNLTQFKQSIVYATDAEVEAL